MKNIDFSMNDLVPVILEVVESGGEFRLFPRGTSMLPLLREGQDSVILVKKGPLSVGDICLYRRENGQFVLHRLVGHAKDGTLSFRGDNQSETEHGIHEEQVLAVVSAYYRGDKRISVGSLRHKLYRVAHIAALRRAVRALRAKQNKKDR